MGTIQFEGMEFFSFHGCFKEEQIIGTKFIVDLEIESDTSEAEKSDRLHDTLDYVHVYQTVKNEMSQKSHLLEHVARRIVDSIRLHFPSVLYIAVKIAKLNPPLGGKTGQVCYKTYWRV